MVALRTLGAAAYLCLTASALRFDEARPKDKKMGACACRNWHTVFKNRYAKCGQGAEYWSRTSDKLAAFMADKDLCRVEPGSHRTPFFLAQQHDLCINFEKVTGPETKIEGGWCYSWPMCMPSGAKLVSDWANWKPCTERDQWLGDLDPSELFAMGQKGNITPADMALYAYSWQEVQDMFETRPVAALTAVTDKLNAGYALKAKGGRITVRNQTWELFEDGATCLEGCPNPQAPTA